MTRQAIASASPTRPSQNQNRPLDSLNNPPLLTIQLVNKMPQGVSFLWSLQREIRTLSV